MRKGMDMFKRTSGRLGAGILAALVVIATLSFLDVRSYAQATYQYGIAWASTGKLALSDTAPTISSGFGSSPSISASNGTTGFLINVGTGGSATSGVIGMPTASTGWICHVNDLTAAAAHVAYNTRQTASSTTTVTVENQTTSTGAAVAWAASDILRLICTAY